MHGGRVRVYYSTDLVGVEIGGAVKNVAIAAGICDGLGLGTTRAPRYHAASPRSRAWARPWARSPTRFSA